MTQPAAFRAVAVRYQVADVERSIDFYTEALGFTLDLDASPAFAKVSNNGLSIYLSGPKSSGARLLPDGTRQSPGGYNRVVLETHDLAVQVQQLKAMGVRFRYDAIISGPGGSQIQIEDPDGNPLELFEPKS